MDGARRAVFSRGGEGDIDRDACDRIDGMLSMLTEMPIALVVLRMHLRYRFYQVFGEQPKDRDRDDDY